MDADLAIDKGVVDPGSIAADVAAEAAVDLIRADHTVVARVVEQLAADGVVLPNGQTLSTQRLVQIMEVTFPSVNGVPADAAATLGIPSLAPQSADPRALTAVLRIATGRATDLDLMFLQRQSLFVELLSAPDADPDAAMEQARREVPWAKQGPGVDADLIMSFVQAGGVITSPTASASAETESTRLAVAMVSEANGGAIEALGNANWHHSNTASREQAFDHGDPSTAHNVPLSDAAIAHAAHQHNRQTLAEAITGMDDSVDVILDGMRGRPLNAKGEADPWFALPTTRQAAATIARMAGTTPARITTHAQAVASIRANLEAAAQGRTEAEVLAEALLLSDAQPDQSRPHPGALNYDRTTDEVHTLRNKLRAHLNQHVVKTRIALDQAAHRTPGIGTLTSIASELGISGEAELMQSLYSGGVSGLGISVGGTNFDAQSNNELIDTKKGYDRYITASGRFTTDIADNLRKEAARQVTARDAAAASANIAPPKIVWVMSSPNAARAATAMMQHHGFNIEVRVEAEHVAASNATRTAVASANYDAALEAAIARISSATGTTTEAITQHVHDSGLTTQSPTAPTQLGPGFPNADNHAKERRSAARQAPAKKRRAAYRKAAAAAAQNVATRWQQLGVEPTPTSRDVTSRRERLSTAAADPRVIATVINDISEALGWNGKDPTARPSLQAMYDAARSSTSPKTRTLIDQRAAIREAFAAPQTTAESQQRFNDLLGAMEDSSVHRASIILDALIATDAATEIRTHIRTQAAAAQNPTQSTTSSNSTSDSAFESTNASESDTQSEQRSTLRDAVASVMAKYNAVKAFFAAAFSPAHRTPQSVLNVVDMAATMPGSALSTLTAAEVEALYSFTFNHNGWTVNSAFDSVHDAEAAWVAMVIGQASDAQIDAFNNQVEHMQWAADNSDSDGNFQSGGHYSRPPSGSAHEQIWANDAYNLIRQDTNDVSDIVTALASVTDSDGNPIFTEEVVTRLKNHLFNDEHLLSAYDNDTGNYLVNSNGERVTELSRFDADANIAEAWMRTSSGRPTETDVLLFMHELVESQFMLDNPGTTYAQAHHAANQQYNWETTIDSVGRHGRGESATEWGARHGDQPAVSTGEPESDSGGIRGPTRPGQSERSPSTNRPVRSGGRSTDVPRAHDPSGPGRDPQDHLPQSDRGPVAPRRPHSGLTDPDADTPHHDDRAARSPSDQTSHEHATRETTTTTEDNHGDGQISQNPGNRGPSPLPSSADPRAEVRGGNRQSEPSTPLGPPGIGRSGWSPVAAPDPTPAESRSRDDQTDPVSGRGQVQDVAFGQPETADPAVAPDTLLSLDLANDRGVVDPGSIAADVAAEAAVDLIRADHTVSARVVEQLAADGVVLPNGQTLSTQRVVQIMEVTFPSVNGVPADAARTLGLPSIPASEADQSELTAVLRIATGEATDLDLMFLQRQSLLVDLLSAPNADPDAAHDEAERQVPWTEQGPGVDAELIMRFVQAGGVITSEAASASIETDHTRLAVAIVSEANGGAIEALGNANWHHSNTASREAAFDHGDPSTTHNVPLSDAAIAHAAHQHNRQTLAEAITGMGDSIVDVILDGMRGRPGTDDSKPWFALSSTRQAAATIARMAGTTPPRITTNAQAVASIRANLQAAAQGRTKAEVLAEALLLSDAQPHQSRPHPGALNYDRTTDEVHTLRNKLRAHLNQHVVDARIALDQAAHRTPSIGTLTSIASELGITGEAELMQSLYSGGVSGLGISVGGTNFDAQSNNELIDTKKGYDRYITASGRFTTDIADNLRKEAARQVTARDAAAASANIAPPKIVWVMSSPNAARAATAMMQHHGFNIEVRLEAEHVAASNATRTAVASANYDAALEAAIARISSATGTTTEAITEQVHDSGLTTQSPTAATQLGPGFPNPDNHAGDRERAARQAPAKKRRAAYRKAAAAAAQNVATRWQQLGVEPTPTSRDVTSRRERLSTAAADPRVIATVITDISEALGWSGKDPTARPSLQAMYDAVRLSSSPKTRTLIDQRAAIREAFAAPQTTAESQQRFNDLLGAMADSSVHRASIILDALIATDAATHIRTHIRTQAAAAQNPTQSTPNSPAPDADPATAEDVAAGTPHEIAAGTASAIDGSRFSGNERLIARPRAVARLIQSAFDARIDDRSRLETFTGVTSITDLGDARFLVTTANGSPFVMTARPGDLRGAPGTVPVARYVSTGEVEVDGHRVPSFAVDVSDRARSADVARALAHELAEISARVDAVGGLVDVLSPGVDSGGPLNPDLLSPHDRGRLSEVRLLSHEVRHGGWLAQRNAQRELTALVRALGLDLAVDGPTIGLDFSTMTVEGIAAELTRMATDTSSEGSPYARRLAAVPGDLRADVILASISTAELNLPPGIPALGTLLTRNLLTQLGGGIATAGAIVVTNGVGPASLTRGIATIGTRLVTSVTGAFNEHAHLRRGAGRALIRDALSIGAGNAHDAAAAQLGRDAAETLRSIQEQRAPHTAIETTASTPTSSESLQALSHFQRYGANSAIESGIFHVSDEVIGALSPAAAAFLDPSVLSSHGGIVGALAATVAETYLTRINSVAASARSQALGDIQSDVARVISEIITVSALEIEAQLDARASAIRDATSHESEAALARPVPAVPNVADVLRDTTRRVFAQIAPSTDVQDQLGALVDAAERSRSGFLGDHRSRRTPQQVAFEQFLIEHDLAPRFMAQPSPSHDPTDAPSEAHLWYLRLAALDDRQLAHRVMALLDIPSGVADLGRFIAKGVVGSGTATGASVATFGMITGTDPAVVIGEAIATALGSGTVAGAAEFAAQRSAERRRERHDPLRADVPHVDLAKYANPLHSLQDIVNLLAATSDPSATLPDAVDGEYAGVLKEFFGDPDPTVTPAPRLNRFVFGSRYSAAGALSAALQALGFTNPTLAAATAASTIATSAGEAAVKSQAEITAARRDLFLRIIADDVTRAIAARADHGAPSMTFDPRTHDIDTAITGALSGTDLDVTTATLETVQQRIDALLATHPPGAARHDLHRASEFAAAARQQIDEIRAAIDAARAHPATAAEHLAEIARMTQQLSDYLNIADNSQVAAQQKVDQRPNDSSAGPTAPPTSPDAPDAASDAAPGEARPDGLSPDGPSPDEPRRSTPTDWAEIRRVSQSNGWRDDRDVDPITVLDPTLPSIPPQPALPPSVQDPVDAVPHDEPASNDAAAPGAPPASPQPSDAIEPLPPPAPTPAPPPPAEHCAAVHEPAPCAAAGDRAEDIGLRAATRAAQRLNLRVAILNHNSLRIWTSDGQRIDLVFTASNSVERDLAIDVERSGDTVTVLVSTTAVAADIAVDIAAGISAVALAQMLDPATPPVFDPDLPPIAGAPLSLRDAQDIAVVSELVWQVDHGCPSNRGTSLAALALTLHDLGLHDSQPGHDVRATYLPATVTADLERLRTQWITVDIPDEATGDAVCAPEESFWDVVDQINDQSDWSGTINDGHSR